MQGFQVCTGKITCFVKECQTENLAVMIYHDGEEWEVYYKRPGCPFTFAFGGTQAFSMDEIHKMAVSHYVGNKELWDSILQ